MYNFDEIHRTKNSYYKNSSARNKKLFKTDKVMPFWIADMNFKIALPITESLQEIVSRGIYAYEGEPEGYTQSIANWFNQQHAYQLYSNRFLEVPGTLTGISFLTDVFSKENDNILIQPPVYHNFKSTIVNMKRCVVNNPLKIENGSYEMDFEDLEQKFKSKNIKIMILCNPHNPIGRVWEKDRIEKIISLTKKYKVILISDEIHSEIIFGDRKMNSLTQYEKEDNIISILGSPGKTFGLQSIAIGFFYINNLELYKSLKKRIEALNLNHINTFSRYATCAAYKEGKQWFSEMKKYIEKNYDWIHRFVKMELPKVKLFPLHSTYLIWLDFNGLNLDKTTLEHLLFVKAGVGFAPGDWFGKEGLGFMRMTIAYPLPVLQKAFYQLKIVLSKV